MSHLQILLRRRSLESKWGIQLSYDYSRKLIKVASVMENSIFRTQLRVNDELVKLNGVDPALRFRDIKDLHAFMSKALSINLTVKRPFSNEGKDYLPIDAAIVEQDYTSTCIPTSNSNSGSPVSNKRKRKNENECNNKDGDDGGDDDDIVEIRSSSNSTRIKSIENVCNGSDTKLVCDDDDDEVKFIGGNVDTALFNMPHHRQHCPLHSFQSWEQQDAGAHVDEVAVVQINRNICKYCYCHVCEIKASECSQWEKHCLHCLKKGKTKEKRGGQENTSTGATVIFVTETATAPAEIS